MSRTFSSGCNRTLGPLRERKSVSSWLPLATLRGAQIRREKESPLFAQTGQTTLGLVIQLPCRKDRFFCVNLLWRVYSKKANGLPHQTKSQLARQMVDGIAA